MMNFGQRLSALRKEKGYTQKSFAQELGVTERSIRAYENGTRHPDFNGLLALADYFNVSLDYLVWTTWWAVPTTGRLSGRGDLWSPARWRPGLRRPHFLSKESGGKERAGRGISSSPALHPPLRSTKKGELRFPLLGISPELFYR